MPRLNQIFMAAAKALPLAAIACWSGCYSPRTLDGKLEQEALRVARKEKDISGEAVADSSSGLRLPELVPDAALRLDRTNVLAIAAGSSRDLQTRREDLYRAGLSLFGTRRDFGLEVSGIIDYVFSGGDEQTDREDGRGAVAAERILPTGGRISLSGSQDMRQEDRGDAADDETSSRAEVRLEQPLLAGAGYGNSHEDLIQASRDYVYALRRFALERQDFAVNTLREYYNLIGQARVLENTRTNYQQFIFLRQRSEALFKVSRAPAIDVMRSQQEELSALNRLTSTEESYRIQIGRFLVLLGLSPDLPVELADDIPTLREVGMDEEKAVRLALDQRLDVKTSRDQLDDARRKLEVARNAFLPEVNLFGANVWTVEDAGEEDGQDDRRQQWEAGVRAEIPFDRRPERDAIRQAELNLDEAARRLDEVLDNTALEVRESYSKLRSLSVSVTIQLKNIEIAERRATNALLQFRNGKLSNRDVVEAANDLLNARNAYIGALADYEIQRLTLLRQVGLLDVSRDGDIVEHAPDI